jgi:hypothetical protein
MRQIMAIENNNLIYIYDKANKMEYWGTLEERHQYKTTNTGIIMLIRDYRLRITHKFPLGYVLSEFISLNENAALEQYKDLLELDGDDGFVEYVDGSDKMFNHYKAIDPQSTALLGMSDSAEGSYVELLEIANLVAVFRKYIDLCLNDHELFTEAWYRSLEIVCESSNNFRGYIEIMEIDYSRRDFYNWSKETPVVIDLENQFFIDSKKNPEMNTSHLQSMLSSNLEVITRRVGIGNLRFALPYTNPKEYLLVSLLNLIEYKTSESSTKKSSAHQFKAIPRKCENCERYFVPMKKNDTIFCNRKSLSNPALDCATDGKQKRQKAKKDSDETIELYGNLYRRRYIAAMRFPKHKPAFERFKTEVKHWKSEVKAGTKTKTDYLIWLRDEYNKY